MILKEKKTQVILDNATHEGDTGSPEVQPDCYFLTLPL